VKHPLKEVKASGRCHEIGKDAIMSKHN